jgi:hypothetical protein
MHLDPERLRRLTTSVQAIDRVDPRTARRLTWPAELDHLRMDASGALVRDWRGALLGLEHGEHTVVQEATRPGEHGVWFGVGSGRGLDTALARGERFVLWEPDPSLLRLVLSRTNWADAIAEDRLRIVLGADLVALARRRPGGPLVVDAATAHMRAPELRLLRAGGTRPIALLVEGRLLVDGIAAALERRGVDGYQLDVERLSRDELDHAVRTLAPKFAIAINETTGLAAFTADHDLPLAIWEIDPTTDSPRPLDRRTPRAQVFTYRRSHVDGFRAAGYEHVEYLPLCADPIARRPRRLFGPERVAYSAPVAFVGASMAVQARAHIERFATQLGSLRGTNQNALAADLAGVERAIAEQCEDLGTYRLPELLRRHAGAALDLWNGSPVVTESAEALLSEFVAGKKRAAAIDAVAPFGPHLWGDEGWKEHLAELDAESAGKVRFRGPAGNREEIERIYSGATVNIDIGRLYQNDIVTLRVFDVLACGGLCLTEHNDEVANLFEVGVELDTWSDLDELRAKTAMYLADPARAAEVGAAGRRAIEERHSLDRRLDHMLAGLVAPARSLAA